MTRLRLAAPARPLLAARGAVDEPLPHARPRLVQPGALEHPRERELAQHRLLDGRGQRRLRGSAVGESWATCPLQRIPLARASRRHEGVSSARGQRSAQLAPRLLETAATLRLRSAE